MALKPRRFNHNLHGPLYFLCKTSFGFKETSQETVLVNRVWPYGPVWISKPSRGEIRNILPPKYKTPKLNSPPQKKGGHYINSNTQILRLNQMVKTGGKNKKIQTYRKRNYCYHFLAATMALAAVAALAGWRPFLPFLTLVPFWPFLPLVPFLPFSSDNVNRHCD